MQTEYDVIIVGGGGSGLAAAASAAESGAAVLLLEKQPQLGGTTGIAIGSLTANRTVLQQRAGIEDSLDAHVEDAGRFAAAEIEMRNHALLREFFLSHTAATLQWLINLGLVFHGPSPEPPNRVPRMHNVVPNAKAYIAALHARVLRYGGTVQCNAGVTSLNQESGRVVGVTATIKGHSVSLKARRGVVLAAGDYAGSSELIARFKGSQYAQVEGINPHATGDGHRLAESIGAELVNMDVTYGPELRFVPPKRDNVTAFAQLLPSRGWLAQAMGRLLPYIPSVLMAAFIRRLLVTWQHPEDALFADGAILVNRLGERFCDERVWPERELAVARQPNRVAYLILDRALIDRYSAWPNFISTAPKIAYAYVDDYLKLRPDIACVGPDLRALAEKKALPADNVQAVIDAAAEGRFRRRGDRWAILGPVKAYFTTTEGGASIDQQFRVLDTQQQPIEGLYAVGQNGLGGMILWGHGLHIAWAITSGRMVGRLLAATTQVRQEATSDVKR